MSFFDDLGKKLSQAGQTAVQKTKEMADVAKLNSAISDEESGLTTIICKSVSSMFRCMMRSMRLISMHLLPRFMRLRVRLRAIGSRSRTLRVS